MKIHQLLISAIACALQEVFCQGYWADKVIQRQLKIQKKWGSRDRRFFAETTYDIVRWWRLLRFLAGKEEHELTIAHLEQLVRLWIDEVSQRVGLSNDPEIKGLPRAIRESIPDWLDELGEREVKESWPAVLQQLNQPAPVVLRVNNLRGNVKEVIDRLASDGIEVETSALGINTLILKKRANVFQTKAFKEGLFEVQDGASQLIAPLLDPKPGQRVIDGCAGAGGKTLHLADLMKNQGRIIALDTHEQKLAEMKKRLARAGVDIVEIRWISSTKVIKRLEATADRVLLDVPCSGLGVLRRNPDAKWKLRPETIDELRLTQKEILESYSRCLKPGGLLVYATCSILPSENQEQVGAFLQRDPRWQLQRELIRMPGEDRFDGFYAALLSLQNA